jgi:hypothetical protein
MDVQYTNITANIASGNHGWNGRMKAEMFPERVLRSNVDFQNV